jgi:hypothetical protein
MRRVAFTNAYNYSHGSIREPTERELAESCSHVVFSSDWDQQNIRFPKPRVLWRRKLLGWSVTKHRIMWSRMISDEALDTDDHEYHRDSTSASFTSGRTAMSQDIASTGRIISQDISIARTKECHLSITQDARAKDGRFEEGTSEGSSEENLAATGAIGSDAVDASLSCRQDVWEQASDKQSVGKREFLCGNIPDRDEKGCRSSTPGVQGWIQSETSSGWRSSRMHQAFMKNCQKRKSLRARVLELEPCQGYDSWASSEMVSNHDPERPAKYYTIFGRKWPKDWNWKMSQTLVGQNGLHFLV